AWVHPAEFHPINQPPFPQEELGSTPLHVTVVIPPDVSAQLPAGKYSAAAVFDTTREPDPQVWHGRLEADGEEFTIERAASAAAQAKVLTRQATHAADWQRDWRKAE